MKLSLLIKARHSKTPLHIRSFPLGSRPLFFSDNNYNTKSMCCCEQHLSLEERSFAFFLLNKIQTSGTHPSRIARPRPKHEPGHIIRMRQVRGPRRLPHMQQPAGLHSSSPASTSSRSLHHLPAPWGRPKSCRGACFPPAGLGFRV